MRANFGCESTQQASNSAGLPERASGTSTAQIDHCLLSRERVTGVAQVHDKWSSPLIDCWAEGAALFNMRYRHFRPRSLIGHMDGRVELPRQCFNDAGAEARF